MPLRVLIAPDKFKGTLTAAEAAKAIAEGWRRIRPEDSLTLLPISDGGDGFGSVLAGRLGAGRHTVETVDAAHRPIQAHWWYDPDSGRALIESAAIIGLALLPAGRFHPFELDTTGLGAALEAARQAGAREILMGIGGSATNDAGFGLARALGWRFLDPAGQSIERWTGLDRLHRWQAPESPFPVPVTVAVDVDNPLLGPRGCSRVYGPQKGLRPEDLPVADAALGRLAEVAAKTVGSRLDTLPGSGAAGGLGFGLRLFLGATLESGFAIVARTTGLVAEIDRADLVLTGEGCIDEQTLMGKGTGQIARLCRERGKPCWGMAGLVGGVPGTTVTPDSATDTPLPLFERLAAIAPELAPPSEARAHAAYWLGELGARMAAH
ncbi:MAG: glycerate kinase [Verrucomicrobia bacterium]|nr:glycerate kinase [Verrucomicrobiota bacterium]